ncbi:MAG: TIGR02996 domain-containing protein [Fimbriiglobus sp.]
MAKPANQTIRLVYADWLEERNDPRAELVRIQVRLRELPLAERLTSDLRAREKVLRTGLPEYWLARLDPPVWCAVGNIVAERPRFGEQPVVRGTRLFRPNAKLYLADVSRGCGITNPAAHASSSMRVVGQHRQSRTWIESWIRVSLTTNWRVRLIHHPGAMVRLRASGWVGFALDPDEFDCPPDHASPEALRALLEAVVAAGARITPGPDAPR